MHYTPLSPVSFLTGQLPQIPPRTKSRLALYPYSTAPSPPRLLLVPLHRLRLEPVLLVLAGLPPPHSVRTLCTQISLLGRPWTSRDTLREFHTPDTCFTTPVRSDKSVSLTKDPLHQARRLRPGSSLLHNARRIANHMAQRALWKWLRGRFQEPRCGILLRGAADPVGFCGGFFEETVGVDAGGVDGLL